MSENDSLKKQIMDRNKQLHAHRDEYLDEWRDSADFVLGYMPKALLGTNQSRTKRQRNEHLLNEAGLWGAQVLASGMMAGITSPARKWFELTTPDKDMMDSSAVKEWLKLVEDRMMGILAGSNFYRTMYTMYMQMGVFGQGAVCAYEDFEDVVRFENYDIGTYALAQDGFGRVDRFYREYNMTVREAVTRFGLDSLSANHQKMYQNNETESLIQMLHAIEANDGRNPNSPLAKDMPWRSAYMESNDNNSPIIKWSGFNTKPFFAPRWSVIGEDVYATSYPAFNAMGSNKAMQVEEMDKAVAIEKQHNPPLVGDAALQNSGLDLIAGGVSFIPNMAQYGKPGLAPVYNVNPQVDHLRLDIKEKEERVHKAFYADLFLMLSQSDRRQITATEILEQKEEKLLMLGPVLERINDEALDPIIDRVFDIADRKGLIPPAPPELQGIPLKIEYVSILAKAQKAVSTQSMDVTAAFITNLSSFMPEALDKLNPDEMIEEYARAKGAPPSMIRTDEEAAVIRQQRAEARQAQMQQEQAVQAAESASKLGNTPIGGGTALDGVLDNLT